MLPIARGDTERLRQMLSLQRRIADLEMSPRAKRALMHRGPFEDALTWLEIHGHAPAVLEHWKGFIEARGAEAKHNAGGGDGADAGRRRGAAGRRRGGGAADVGGFKRPPKPDARSDAYAVDLLPVLPSNSCMNATSASTPSSGKAL